VNFSPKLTLTYTRDVYKQEVALFNAEEKAKSSPILLGPLGGGTREITEEESGRITEEEEEI